MLAAGLVDELRLVIAPVVVGAGRRLFPDGGAPAGLRLVRNDTTPAGLAIHVYEPTGRRCTAPTAPDLGGSCPGRHPPRV